ncbi:MAG TPA: glycosyltransferase family 1 protein [Tianweitania sediminis]|jgi:alpha-1,3-rhamnosyl/mannosyltransferase|nr:glycosyltransferase family 1 protein [Tianweitania sediminis]
MKIILSVDPIRFPMTGIGRYTLELAKQLPLMPGIESVRYFSSNGFVGSLPTPPSASSEGRVQQRVGLIRRSKQSLARLPLVLDAYRLLSRKQKADALLGMDEFLYHGPNFYLPPFTGRSVVTIHDLSVFTMPEHHPVERVKMLRKEVEAALKQATMLITDSDYTRREVAAYFSWPLDKVRTAALAGGVEFYPREAETLRPVLAQYALQPQGYTLYTGTIEPRKNLVRLLDAYSEMPVALRQRYPLILSGYRGWNNRAIMDRIATAEGQGWARYLGFVPDSDLPLLFAGARLFAFPSLYEGFGLPVLEAMASGVPVVTSTASSLPEVGGDAAATCDPEDIEMLCDLLRQGLENNDWRQEAIAKGIEQAAKFSWRRCAEETVSIYHSALTSS